MMAGFPHPRHWVRRLLLLLFFLSGASALIYEVTWTRRLTHIFGSTTLAVSTVLAAFMGGLALGSYLLGRVADRRAGKALATYGALEISVGLLALGVPLFLRGVAAIYLALAPLLERVPQLFFFIQFLLVGAVIVLPTALMGGTFPVLARWLVAREDEVSVRVGSLYAANTLGAGAGTALATYLLLPVVGVWKSELLAVVGNGIAGATALALDRRWRATAAGSETPAAGTVCAVPDDPPPRTRRILLLGIALSGFAAMVDEVTWSRILALVLGSSVYAFGMMLLLLLVGLAIGSALFSRLRPAHPVPLFALALIGNSLAVVAGIALVPRLPTLFLGGFRTVRGSFLMQQSFELLLAGGLVLPAAVLFGVAFPAAVAAIADALRVGRDVGRVTACNTIGTVAGAFLAGFVLIPRFGLRATLTVGVAAAAAAGMLSLRLVKSRTWRHTGFVGAAVALLAALVIPAWPQKLLVMGAGFYASLYESPQELLDAARDRQLLFYKDGVATTLSVDQQGDYKYYRSNGKTDASTHPGDMANQILLGQLPMLLHPNPKDVFMLGLGTGVSAAAVARYPVRSIGIVDIEAAARQATRLFATENRNIVADPRVRLLVADGRNALLARRQSYDVIISDPSDVWVAGVGNLFTREFYALARSRLRPQGIMVQWFHMHSLPPNQLRLIVATFRSVFPYASFWRPNRGDVILLGTANPLPWDYPRLKERIENVPGVRQDLLALGLWQPLSVFAAFVLEGEDLNRMLSGVAEVHTDDRPVIEYLSPRAAYADTTAINDPGVQAFQARFFPAMTGFDLNRDVDARAVYLLGFGHASLGRTESAIKLMEESVARDPKNAKYWIGLGNQYRTKAAESRAIGSYRRALSLEPGEPEATINLAALLRSNGEDAEAERLLRAGLAASSADAPLQAAAARLFLDTGRAREALSLLEPAVQKEPQNGELRLLLGRCLAAVGRREEAIRELRSACALAPNDAAFQLAAARALLQAGDADGAATSSAKAVALDPNNVEALLTLAEASQRRGDLEGARRARERAAGLAPYNPALARP